jgi:predicted  nucleic acid-binding Zn-ribbon protein
MSAVSPNRLSIQAETDIAVLQVEIRNLDEKIDDMKNTLKEIHASLSKHNDKTLAAIAEIKEGHESSLNKVSEKISNIEKWRWMVMGAGVVLGALGWHGIAKIILS